MITDLSQVQLSLNKYTTSNGKDIGRFFYRLEWYRIGISIPMDVYSEKMPVFQLRPECQLTHTEELQELASNTKEIKFKIFVIPYKTVDKNEDLTDDFLKNWFKKKIKGAAELLTVETGPNNRIYYKKKPEDKILQQIQSYSLKGKLKCLDSKKLEILRQSPIGYYDNLGCGLLDLE